MNPKKMFICFALISLLSACHSSGNKSKTEDLLNDDDVSQYALASCKYGFTEGAMNTTWSSRIEKTAFGKRFDAGKLDAVLDASLDSIVNLAALTGAIYYKTDKYADNSCPSTDSLPQAPNDLQEYLDEVDSAGNIMGLYLQKETPNLPSTQHSAAILVKSDSNKWVVVHEFMHHLFQTQFTQDTGIADIKAHLELVETRYQKALSKISKYSSRYDQQSKEEAQTLIDAQAEYQQTLLDLIKTYPLEEVSIENKLAYEFESGNFTEVVEGQKINGAAYIISSSEKAIDLFGYLEDIDDNTRKVLGFTYYKADISRLREINDSVRDYRTETYRLKRAAQEYLEEKNLSYGILKAAKGPTEHVHSPGCSRQKEFDQIMDKIKNKLDQKRKSHL